MNALVFYGQKNKPEQIITHRLSLEEGPDACDVFNKQDNCIKVVLYPGK